MNQAWFAGDLHLSHGKILLYQKNERPFASKDLLEKLKDPKLKYENIKEELDKSLEVHNQHIIDRLNKYVKKNDTLWILGDVCFGNKEGLKYIERLNCKNKKLVLGNHDKLPISDYLSVGFSKIYGMVRHKEFVLTHAPVHTQQLEGRYKGNIHGHLHTCNIPDNRYINVNIDMTNITPLSLEEIRCKLKK